MRILQLNNSEDVRKIMRDIRVDRYGIDIMLPKAVACLLRMNSVSNITANILKQQMLSLGGDVAVSRDSLIGRGKVTDCLLIGSLSQLNQLQQKLKLQPFGLKNIALDLSCALDNYQKEEFVIQLPRQRFNLRRGRCYLMGILNLTPDSFSGDGLYALSVNEIIDVAQKLAQDGADIIDIGGESSRPGAKAVSLKEELNRVIPVIKALAKKIKVPLSVDTSKPEVARDALDNGAQIVNDITGLRNARMSRVVSKYDAAVVMMHMRGNPRTMQSNPVYGSLIDEILEYLKAALKRAAQGGIKKEKIIIDPGLGFGKTAEHNLEIIRNLRDFKVLGRPILAGPSRKSFIGKILNAHPGDRVFGTVSASVLAANNGAKIVRVHDVKEVKQALKVSETINRCKDANKC
ncbi:MAG: dihydropteroate synthase [Candidatus Omnitrophota bacterium]|nr:dihydropteroate synthase [Candidatus Omnitrophota bacterium]